MRTRPRILGIPTDPVTYAELLAHIEAWMEAGAGLHQICTVNPEFIMLAQKHPTFYAVLQNADLNVLDGWGAVWALRLRGVRVPQRVTGSDGVPFLAEHAARLGWRIFMLGAAEGVAEEAAKRLQRDHPALQIVGCYAGSPAPSEASALVERINASGADMLWVAYGAPQQDLWIAAQRGQLQVKVALGVGGAFDFLAGRVPRAPRWMQNSGLEWLYRLYKQPWRWRRMLRLPLFALCALYYGERPLPKRQKEA